jgi:hypothetical protein
MFFLNQELQVEFYGYVWWSVRKLNEHETKQKN